MNKVISRLLTFFIGVPIFVGLCLIDFQNHLPLTILTLVGTVIGTIELHKMFSKKSELFNIVLLSIFSAIQPLLVYIFHLLNTYNVTFTPIDINIIAWILCAEIAILMGIECFTAKSFENSASKIAYSVLIIFYVGFMVASFMKFITLEYSSWILLTFFLLVFMCDSLAWLFGVLFGKSTRGFVAASPNKSLVGFIGGIIGSIAIGCLIKYILNLNNIDFMPGPWWKVILLSFITALSAIIGDLIESVLKRSCDVKDSGFIIPGRGGILDSIDSLLIASPVVYLGYHFLYEIL